MWRSRAGATAGSIRTGGCRSRPSRPPRAQAVAERSWPSRTPARRRAGSGSCPCAPPAAAAGLPAWTTGVRVRATPGGRDSRARAAGCWRCGRASATAPTRSTRPSGARGAQLAHRQIDRIDEYIAACQVGITLASIGIGAVGEPVIAHYLKKPLGTPVGHAAAVTIAGVIAYLILTTTHITFGELAPKIFTVAHPETVARRLARPLEFFTALFRPVSTTLTALARLI